MSSPLHSPDERASMTFADLAERIHALPPRLGPVRLVCVDGPTCSGKTTLAGRLAAALGGAPTIRMDDLYDGWDGLEAGTERLRDWVLDPVRAGRPGRYRRYDWIRGEYAEWHEVPLAPVLVVEGVGSASRVVDRSAALILWVEAPEEVRYARGVTRDQGGFGPYWAAWARAEAAHFAQQDTRARADVHVDGAPDQTYDAQAEFVLSG
ncbi:uridine kinase [Actinopolymorpha pittospori]|uniref:Uridine kinase n=1 Tax=Actinopolymorpha pittospori TaxID=648752 RepID=A0A927MZP2_9ACTN|nr:uridine kinase [Actinopolymorpha pittospori]